MENTKECGRRNQGATGTPTVHHNNYLGFRPRSGNEIADGLIDPIIDEAKVIHQEYGEILRPPIQMMHKDHTWP